MITTESSISDHAVPAPTARRGGADPTRITRISKLKDHLIFRAFTWPTNLEPFARFNVIYGWNGSGKTTLSSLFANLQHRSAIIEGEVEFEIGGMKVAGSALAIATLPAVRVFNQHFRDAVILASGKQVEAIYYLGEDSVEKQKQVAVLREELKNAEAMLTTAQKSKSFAVKALDDFCVNKAKLIKDLLIGPRSTKYNNYDKRFFQRAIDKLSEESVNAASQTETNKEKLLLQKNAKLMDAVAGVEIAVPDFEVLTAETDTLLKQSVVSQVLDELAADNEVSSWVQRGLALHTGERYCATCRFCGLPISASRLQKIEGHFNDVYTSFQAKVDALANRVQATKVVLTEARLPEPSRLYEHLKTEFEPIVSRASSLFEEAADYQGLLHQALLSKRKLPFEAISLDVTLQGKSCPDRLALAQVIDAINAVIDKHNAITTDFERQLEQACVSLEQCYVAEAFSEYTDLSLEVSEAMSIAQSSTVKRDDLRKRISEIEKEIVEHLRPADELNAELRSYLGRDELHFEVKENGYAITRHGRPATHLSEGEKTAIAFLYFLKSLQDKSFDLTSSIVVIDDPVSSLDANALFSAFGNMKDRTKDSGQLFILTHNFGFFSQVKNWFHHLERSQRPPRFYSLKSTCVDGHRSAVLAPIDPLLEKYESEYHYLFKRVYDEANCPNAESSLEAYYGMPNIARRLLEAFLAFRHPADAHGDGKLYKLFEKVSFDGAKKTRIYRFLQTYCHLDRIRDPEHDPSVLSETKQVLCDIIEMIKHCDPSHFNGMMKIVAPSEVESDE